MRHLILIIFIVLVFLIAYFIALNSKESNDTNKACTKALRDFFGESWINNTIKLINASRTVDGGYAEFQTEPKLYSTYYFVLTSQLLKIELIFRNQTVSYLEEELEKFNSQRNSMEDLYYISKTLFLLDKNKFNKHKSKICGLFLQYQLKNGSLAEINSNSTVFDDLIASEIIKMCSIDLENFKKYLLKKYSELNGSDIFEIERIIVSLHNIGINVEELPDIERCKTFIKSYASNISIENLKSGGLLELLALINIANTLNVNLSLSNDILDYIAESQNEDGGFSFWFKNTSDEFGTYAATKILITFKREIKNKEKLVEFIRVHELPKGGFSPAVRVITNAVSTFHAVNVLLDLGSFPDDSAISFLKLRYSKAITDLHRGIINLDLYPTAMALAMIGEKVHDVDACIPYIDMFLSGEIPHPKILHMFLMVLKSANYTLDEERRNKIAVKMRDFEKDGYYCFKTECNTFEAQRDTAVALEILNYINDKPRNKNAIVKWLKSHRNKDGGYGFNGTSNIMSTYFVVKSLKLLDKEPDDPESILRFLNKCKRLYGFSFSPDYDEYRLIFTYYGVKIAKLIVCE